MKYNSTAADEITTESRADDSALARRKTLSVFAGGVLVGVSSAGVATSATGTTKSVETWQNDRDARGHDLRDAATVGASSVTFEEYDRDVLGPIESLTVHESEVDHPYIAARPADRVVWRDEDGTFHADGPDGTVASGDFLTIVQAAADSLSQGRTHKERVLIASPAVLDGNADS